MDLITEPATLVTDYLLAAFTGILAWRLYTGAEAHLPRTRRWWAAAFAATAVAGVTGGTVHGLTRVLGPHATALLWIVTVEAIVASAAATVLAALSTADLGARTVRAATMAACVAYGGYALWLPGHPRFGYAMIGYGSALAVLVALQVRSMVRGRSRAAAWFLSSVGVSVLAAIVQQSGWSLHRHFNHNDLFHVVQAVAVWLLYGGARSAFQFDVAAETPRRGAI